MTLVLINDMNEVKNISEMMVNDFKGKNEVNHGIGFEINMSNDINTQKVGKEFTMKFNQILLTAFAIFGLVMLTTPATQAQTCDGNGNHFIDLNGDGFNDNAPDADGDGIPNGLDPDYIKQAQDGDGYKNGSLGENKGEKMTQKKAMTKTQKFNKVQNKVQAFEGNMFQKRLGALGTSSGSGAGVCDGSGGGLAGTGVCDGSGPNGTQQRGGK